MNIHSSVATPSAPRWGRRRLSGLPLGWRPGLRLSCLLTGLALLSACGQKGALSLPAPVTLPASAASAAATK